MSCFWRALAVGWILSSLAIAAPARSDDATAPPFASQLRAEWSVEPTRAGRARVVGYLYNSGINDAANVWLRVDRLDALGKVDGSYRGRVVGDVLSGGRLVFDVNVPDPTATYRVSVEQVDWVKECR